MRPSPRDVVRFDGGLYSDRVMVDSFAVMSVPIEALKGAHYIIDRQTEQIAALRTRVTELEREQAQLEWIANHAIDQARDQYPEKEEKR